MRIILTIGLVLSLWSVPSMARELVVGWVDVPWLIDKSPQSLEAGKRLEKEFAPRQKILKEESAELAEKRSKLAKESLVLSETERSELELSIRKLERRLKRQEQDFREELNIKKNNEFKKVRKLVSKAILKFADTGEYDLILSEGVWFAHKRIDITEQIIKIMGEVDQSTAEKQ